MGVVDITEWPVGQLSTAGFRKGLRMVEVSDDDKLGLAIAKEMHSLEGTSKAWAVQMEAAGAGWARASMVLREDMTNGHGNAHGGVIFSLADTAFAWACNSRNVRTVAQHASISFLSPGKTGEKLIAEAREETLSGRSGVYIVTVYGEDKRIVAIFKGLSRSIGGKVIEKGVL